MEREIEQVVVDVKRTRNESVLLLVLYKFHIDNLYTIFDTLRQSFHIWSGIMRLN